MTDTRRPLTNIDDIRKLPRTHRNPVTRSDMYAWWGPVVVDEYVDDTFRFAYQVDERSRRFCVADFGVTAGTFGPWTDF
jgi:hypothetical protein